MEEYLYRIYENIYHGFGQMIIKAAVRGLQEQAHIMRRETFGYLVVTGDYIEGGLKTKQLVLTAY